MTCDAIMTEARERAMSLRLLAVVCGCWPWFAVVGRRWPELTGIKKPSSPLRMGHSSAIAFLLICSMGRAGTLAGAGEPAKTTTY